VVVAGGRAEPGTVRIEQDHRAGKGRNPIDLPTPSDSACFDAGEACLSKHRDQSPEAAMSIENREELRPVPSPEGPQQADPWLKEGPMSPWATWPVVGAVLVLMLMVVFAVAN
jgi:hypothetical protein